MKIQIIEKLQITEIVDARMDSLNQIAKLLTLFARPAQILVHFATQQVVPAKRDISKMKK